MVEVQRPMRCLGNFKRIKFRKKESLNTLILMKNFVYKKFHQDTIDKNFNDPKITVGIDDSEFEKFMELSEKI